MIGASEAPAYVRCYNILARKVTANARDVTARRSDFSMPYVPLIYTSSAPNVASGADLLISSISDFGLSAAHAWGASSAGSASAARRSIPRCLTRSPPPPIHTRPGQAPRRTPPPPPDQPRPPPPPPSGRSRSLHTRSPHDRSSGSVASPSTQRSPHHPPDAADHSRTARSHAAPRRATPSRSMDRSTPGSPHAAPSQWCP